MSSPIRTVESPRSSAQSQAHSQSDRSGDELAFLFKGYERHPTAWDELFGSDDQPHPHCAALLERLGRLTMTEFHQLRAGADLAFINQGITFSVYSDRRGVEKIFPFDLIPRTVSAEEWTTLEAGLRQRVQALNLFLHDIYHDRKILQEGLIPEDLVLQSTSYRPEMVGFEPPGRQYIHVVGTDLIRDAEGQFRVLEDNGRTPSGVSYVLENRSGDEAGLPGVVPGHPGASGRGVSSASAGRAQLGGAGGGGRVAVRGSALAGTLQLGLLRA